MNLKNEIWKDIPGYKKYLVSNLGRIKHKRHDRILNGNVGQLGYRRVTLMSDTSPVRGKTFRIHTIVGKVFVDGDCTLQINHKDGNKLNNRSENLEWVTPLENTRHAIRTGIFSCGEKNGHSKLTEFDVKNIRYLSSFIGTTLLSKAYKVCKSTITDIKYKRTWKHI